MSDILNTTLNVFLPITLACGLAFILITCGLGRALKYAGAFLWSVGESWDAGVKAARAAGREAYRETVRGL
jgi:hypothetical protein